MKTPQSSALTPAYTTGFLLLGSLSILWMAFCLTKGWYWQAGLPIGALLGATALVNERVIFYLLCLCLPFSLDIKLPGTGFSLSAPAEPLVGLLACIALFRFIRIPQAYRVLAHPVSLCILAWWGWQWMNICFSVMPMVSAKWMLVQTAFLLVFYILPAGMESQQEGSIPKGWILFAAIYAVLEIYATWKHSTLGFARHASMETVYPFFNDHTLYGTCGAFIFGLLIILSPYLRKSDYLRGYKSLITLVLPMIPVAVFLSFSRASWISLLVIPGILLMLKWKITPARVLVTLASIGAIALLTFSIWYPMLRHNDSDSKKRKTNLNEQLRSVTNISSDLSNMERLNRWSCALRMSQDHPVTGFGPGTFQFEYTPYQKPMEMTWISMTGYRVKQEAGKGGTAHSEYLLQASESGWIVAGLFIALLFLLFHYGFKVILSQPDPYTRYTVTAALCGVGTYIFHSTFNNFMDQSKTAFLFWSCAAFIVMSHYRLKHNTSATKNN